jgi:uncharacterized phage protein gp47/JayE
MKMAEKTWINKSEKEIRDDIVAIAKEETKLTNFKSTGVLRSFIEVIAKVVIFIYQSAINTIYENATLDGASSFFLSLWGIKLGVVRKQETKTIGRFTGSSSGGGEVPEGTWAVVPGTDLRYKVTEKVPFQEGKTFAIPIIAEFPGMAYNIPAGTPLRCTRVIFGLDSVSASEDWITSLGQDTEEDASYRERIKNRWMSQVLGDTKEVYKFYAEEVTGVRSAKVIRTPRGPGSTDIIVAAVNGDPDAALIEAVQNNLYNHELMAFDIQIKPPLILPINIEIEYSGNADETAVKLTAENYVYSLGIGGRFAVRELYDRYKPFKLDTLEILSPERDVQSEALYIIVGSISAVRIGS